MNMHNVREQKKHKFGIFDPEDNWRFVSYALVIFVALEILSFFVFRFKYHETVGNISCGIGFLLALISGVHSANRMRVLHSEMQYIKTQQIVLETLDEVFSLTAKIAGSETEEGDRK